MGKVKEEQKMQKNIKDKVVTPIVRITITNIQEPEAREEKVWKYPSEEDKEQSKKFWEADPAPELDPTVTNKKVRFGLTRTLEYTPIEGESKKTNWRMFPELFLTDRWAEIYEAVNKYQEIGQESRKSLLKLADRQHQMAKRWGTHSKRIKPQYAATLRLKCGSWSNNNTMATVQALHKLILDLSGRSASNRIAQHEGREYQMVKAIANQWGSENMGKDQEQRKHQDLDLRIMRMKILHTQNPSKLVAPGKDQKSVPGIIAEAMDKIHQLTINAPQTIPEMVRQIREPSKAAKVNVGLVRDLETQLGRAIIHRDCQESNNLAQVGILIANCKRSLNNLYRNVAKKGVEKEGQEYTARGHRRLEKGTHKESNRNPERSR